MEIYYGIPPVDRLSEIKKRYGGVVVSESEALSHSIIFLKEMGVPIITGDSPVQKSAKKESRVKIGGFPVDICCVSGRACEHSLPLGLWRSEAALASGRLPTGSDYIYCARNGAAIRLFDFYGEKKALLGSISEKTALNLQIRTLSLFKSGVLVVLPHTRSAEQILFLKSRLPCAKLCAMYEDVGADIENTCRRVENCFVGSNDLLRAGLTASEVIDFIEKAAYFARKYGKKLIICGKITENEEFLRSCGRIGVSALCIDEDAYPLIARCFT